MKASSVSVTLTRSMMRYAVSRGASLEALCAAAGIEPSLLERPDERITGDQSLKAWNAAVKATGDMDFGLHLGELSQPTRLGLVGFAMISAADLGGALERLVRYTNLLTNGVRGTITRTEALACFELEPTRGVANFLHESPRQHVECTLSAFLALGEALTGRPLPVIEVRFRHPEPPSTREHLRIFRAPVLFGREANRVTLNAAALKWPLADSNPGLLEVFDARAMGAVRKLDQNAPWSERVESALMENLRGTVPSLEETARGLGVSGRILQRRLLDEGTSFRRLLDQARHELSLHHLRRDEVPVAEISYLLGFAEPSAFHRSFRRWTGSTPGSVRNRLHRPGTG
jgi:AraC-like DNA-binding protein